MEINKIYNEDCLVTMARMPNDFIDLSVTSPPYDNLRTYHGYSFPFEQIAKELYRIIKPGGVVVWVVGDRVKQQSETLIPFRQAIFFKEIGFNVHDTMIYQKNAMPFPEQTRYIQCFEYMFIISKGKPKTTNMLKEKTKGYKGSESSSQRLSNGTTRKLKYEQGKELRNRWNVWLYEVGYNKTTKDKNAYKHPAMFPEQLANDHILSWSNPNDFVYDPFMGSGTTAKMCILNNRNFIGSEISSEYCEIANQRIQQTVETQANDRKVSKLEMYGVQI